MHYAGILVAPFILVALAAEPDRTTTVQLAAPDLPEDRDLSVYVDPSTAQVRGVHVTAF